MIIRNITDVDGFFETVDKCSGRVELLTKQGDRLNLKSKLCQYISLTGMFSDPTIEEMDLLVSEPKDMSLLIQYLVRG